jgi:hypothetical protein
MSLPRRAADVVRNHVTLELESIDRMYLNAYVPDLQRELGVVSFFRFHQQRTFASGALMSPISRRFVGKIEAFAHRHQVPLIRFEKGERKEDIARRHRAAFSGPDGVYLIGKAQEKARVFRTERRYDEQGRAYPWIVRSTAMVNHYYFYCLDRDFGPFFLKFCSYFPYNGKLCLNGHEYLKRQLSRRGVPFEALDNGVLSCADSAVAQAVCDGLSAEKIDALVRRWLRVLPHPFSTKDRAAGYRYDVSILQAEFALTQILDRPLTGRIFFEDVIRENLDLGRPDHVQLIFGRRVIKTTPGRFRTRVITDGVIPSLHVDYKHSRIKQYHKEGRGLRTETTINDTRDFYIGRRLVNLPSLREIGFQANRRLLDVQTVSYDSNIGQRALESLQHPVEVDGQRVSALRLGDRRAHAVLSTLPLFHLNATPFTNRDLKQHLAPLMGRTPEQISPGTMSYELRRLRLHGLIERLPKTHRYRVTPYGLRVAAFTTLIYDRLLRPGLASILDPVSADSFQPAHHPLNRIREGIDALCQKPAA